MTATLLLTLDSLRQYVVDTDPLLVDDFQSWADTVIRKVQACIRQPADAPFDEVCTSIRGGLRDYRDRAGRYITEMRSRLTTTTSELHKVLANVQSGEGAVAAQLKTEVSRLGALAELASIQDVRNGLRQSVVSLGECMAQVVQQTDLVAKELRDEIRALQNSLEEARRAATVDVLTDVHSRQEFEQVVTQEILTGHVTNVVHITLQNLGKLATSYQRHTIDQLLNAFCKRARGVLLDDAIVGRWRENVFCAILRSAQTDAVMEGLVRKCSGNYVFMERAYARTLYLQVAVSSFTWGAGTDAQAAFQSLDNSGAV